MPNTKPSQLLSLLRLLRIPNLPSAISNILMAFLLVNHTWTPVVPLVWLIVASSAMYCAGMVLNDVFDYEVDLQQRPDRPIPSGAISKSLAASIGVTLLVAGVIIASLCGAFSGAFTGSALVTCRTGLFAVLLAVCIVLYDGPLKKTILAPLLMGGCRTLNILMGASVFTSVATTQLAQAGAASVIVLPDNELLGMPLLVWWVAIAIGGLITGATLLGRNEAVENQPREPMVVAGFIILASLIVLAFSVYCPTSPVPGEFQISETQKTIFPLFIGFVSLTIMRRVFSAVATLKPKSVQLGVVSVLRSLIIFDAAICYMSAPGQIIYALVVLSLLIPTMLLSRIIPST